MERIRMLLLLAIAGLAGAVAAVGVTACGSDDEEGTNDTVAVEEAETVDVRIREYALEPDDVTVRAGVIEFVVRNDGDGEHRFAVETSEGDVKRTESIAPGETARLKVDLRPGTYDMYDPLGDNRDRGIDGEIEVEERRTDTVTTTDEQTETDERTVTDTDERTITETDERTVTRTETDTTERTQTETETTTAP